MPDAVNGYVKVEAVGPPGVLRTISFAKGETDEGLDLLRPIVVEGVLVVIRHPARGQFPAVVELQVNSVLRSCGWTASRNWGVAEMFYAWLGWRVAETVSALVLRARR